MELRGPGCLTDLGETVPGDRSPEKPASTLQFVRRIFAAGRFLIAPLVARRAMWHSLTVAAR